MENSQPVNFTYEELEVILGRVVSSNPNNQEIKESNTQLKSYLKNILSVEGFINQIKNNQNFKIRQLAAILLYRKFDKHFSKMDETTQMNFKNIIFEGYLQEKNFLVLKAISNIIYKIIRFFLADNTQKAAELLDFVLKDPQSYSQEEADRFVTNLNILCELIENSFVLIEDRAKQIKQIIQISLRMGTNKIKEISAKCLGNFLRANEKSELKFIEDIIPNLIEEIINFNQETVMHIYENFCDFSGKAVEIFQNNIEKITNISLDFLKKDDYDTVTLSVIAEFLILISESNKKFLKKNNCQYLDLSMQQAFKFASQEPAVNEADDNMTKCEIGERLVEEFAQLFPSKFVFEIAMNYIKMMISSDNGFVRRQGIRLIRCIAEGCAEKIKENLADFINLLEEKFHKDTDNRVKIACLMAIDTLSEFCYPQIVEYYDRIIPISITGLFSSEAEIVENSLVAFKFYTQNPDVELAPYIERVLPRLIELLDSKLFYIQRDALAALSVIVDANKDELKNTLIPILETCKNIILNRTHESDIEVRACALDCVGHIANSIKLEKFQPYLAFFSQIAFEGINSQFYEMQAAGFVYLKYICELLGDSFGNDLDNIMPIAMKLLKDDSGIINVKADKLNEDAVEIVNDGNASENDDEDEEDLQAVKVNEAFVQAKCSVINAISSFARNCPTQFVKYIEEILINFDEIIDYVEENVNIELILAYQSLMVSIDKAEKSNNSGNSQSLNLAKKLWMNDILPKFEKIVEDTNLKIEVVNVLESIYGIIDYFGRDMFIENNSLERIFTMVKKLLEFKATCQIKNEEDDLEEDEIDHDAEILDHVCDIFMISAEKLGNDFHPILVSLMDNLKKYLSVNRSLGDRATFFGCLADTLIHCKITVKFYFEYLLGSISENTKKNLKTKDDELFRNMAFLIGTMFEAEPDFGKDFFISGMNQLQIIFENAGKMGKENVLAALCRIVYSLKIDFSSENSEILKKIIESVFSNCPLLNDYHENITVFKLIEYLYNKMDAELYSQYWEKIFAVLKYLALNKNKCNIKDQEFKKIKGLLEIFNNNEMIKGFLEASIANLIVDEKEKFINVIQSV